LTVKVKDANGNPVPGTAVTLSAGGSGNTFGLASGSTDANGVFTTTLASTVAQTETVSATEGIASETTQVSFAAVPSASTSTITANPTIVRADGTATTTLTVTVKDAQGNPVAGTAVTLSANGFANSFGSVSGTSDSNGVFTTTLASALAQTETITATEGSAQETTTITFATPPAGTTSADNYVWATVAGSWDNAANWDDTTARQTPASVAPGSNDNVSINEAGSAGVNVITGVGDAASLTIAGATILAGQFTTGTLNANEALTVSTGDTLMITGNASFQTLTVDGTLTVTGSVPSSPYSFTLNGTATVGGDLALYIFTLNGGMLRVHGNLSDETTGGVVLNGGTVTARSLDLGAQSWSLKNGATLSITGNFTDDSIVGESNALSIDDSTFTVGGTFTTASPGSVSDSISVSNSGRVQLAALATGADVSLVVNDSTSSLEIGTAGGVAAGSLTIDNGVTVTPAVGGFDAPKIVVDGTFETAPGDSFTLDGSLGGNGQIQIGINGNLIVENSLGQPAAATAPTITFLGSAGGLTIYGSALNASNAFVPVIIGLNSSDVIDYEGTATSATPGSFNGTDTVLTLYDNATVVATLTLQGDYSSSTFITTQIGGGVTQIVDPPAPTAGTTSGGNYEISSTSVLSNNATRGTIVADPPANTSPPTSNLNSWVAGDMPTHSSFGLNNTLTTTGLQAPGGPLNNPAGLDHAVALFIQFIAAGFPEQHGGSITTNALSQIMASEQHFLANPHHG
jgi:hypothetical protein